MTSETGSAASFGQESVVIARFDSYRRAERMAASPGREFGRKARKGGAIAVVVRGSPDGSLMVTEPRVLSAGDVASGLMPVSLARIAGFMSPFSMAKGARGGVCAAEGRGGGVGSGEHRAREILAGAGPHRPCWSAARTNRRTRWSPRPRPTAPDMDGMARSRSFSPSLILVALTIGCPPLPVSVPARAARRICPPSWPALVPQPRPWRVSPHDVLVAESVKLTYGPGDLWRRDR
jgi:hypothetical protein